MKVLSYTRPPQAKCMTLRNSKVARSPSATKQRHVTTVVSTSMGVHAGSRVHADPCAARCVENASRVGFGNVDKGSVGVLVHNMTNVASARKIYQRGRLAR